MACVAPEPKVSVHWTRSGATSGRGRDWQPATGLSSSVNETVPVGVPALRGEGVTVAVSVTGWPATGLATDGVIVREVGSGLTTWVMTGEVLPPNRTSPL